MLPATSVVYDDMSVVALSWCSTGSATNTTLHGECSVSENGRSNFIESLLQKKIIIRSKISM